MQLGLYKKGIYFQRRRFVILLNTLLIGPPVYKGSIILSKHIDAESRAFALFIPSKESFTAILNGRGSVVAG